MCALSITKRVLNLLINYLLEEDESRTFNPTKKPKKDRRRKVLLLRNWARKVKIVKIENYLEVVSRYDDDTFRSHFRTNKRVYEILESELKYLYKDGTRRPKVPLRTALVMTLWILATQDTFRAVADRFNLSKSTVHSTALYVCKLICTLASKYIKWPQNEEELKAVAKKFNVLRGSDSFPNVIGCVDGTHIAIPAPSSEPASYYNRKGYHSLILQAVCDSEMRFTNVFFGWPGMAHDASVWANSEMGKKLSNDCINLPSKYHLLGDSAYPLRQYLLTIYDDGTLDRSKSEFNFKHSSTRIVIEQAFGQLKGKFRRLRFLEIRNLKTAKYFVLAAVTIHNVIIDHNIEYENIERSSESSEEDEENDVSHLTSEYREQQNGSGKTKRNFLRSILM